MNQSTPPAGPVRCASPPGWRLSRGKSAGMYGGQGVAIIDPELIFLYYVPLAIAAGSCIYHLGVLVAALRFRRERECPADYTPPVTILKPISGIEPHFHETLRSYFQQDYP